MNYKFLLLASYLFTLLITSADVKTFNTQSDTDIMNGIVSIVRQARSFGCNGQNDRDPYRCKSHCRSRNYKSGRCSKLSNYTRCVCYKSSDTKSLLF